MEHAHELFRPPYLDLPRRLLQLRDPFLPADEVKALSLRCGFDNLDWALGLRVAEQVLPSLSPLLKKKAIHSPTFWLHSG